MPGAVSCLRRSEQVTTVASRRPPEPCAQVRILLGAQLDSHFSKSRFSTVDVCHVCRTYDQKSTLTGQSRVALIVSLAYRPGVAQRVRRYLRTPRHSGGRRRDAHLARAVKAKGSPERGLDRAFDHAVHCPAVASASSSSASVPSRADRRLPPAPNRTGSSRCVAAVALSNRLEARRWFHPRAPRRESAPQSGRWSSRRDLLQG
jgi:hypothetical protein